MCSVHLLSTSSSSATPAKALAHSNVISLTFSPLSTTLFTFERPVKSETDVYKNVKAWNVQTGEEVGGWYQKSQEGW
jgi:translation initiation factor 2A